MKKVLKIIGCLVVGLVALVVALVLALPLWIGPVVTGIANGVAPGILGTSFKLEKFALNPYTGKIFIGGVNLSNPKGYDEPTAVSVESVSVELSFASLFSGKKIHVYGITIEQPFVSYVNDAAGTNNFARILANIEEFKKQNGLAEEAPDAEEDSDEENLRFQIDRLVINGTKVKFLMLPTFPVPVPTLTNLGNSDEGASVEEIEDSVWNSVKDTFNSTGALLGGGLQALGGGATGLFKGVDKAGVATGEGAVKAVEDVGAGAKKALDSVGDGAKKATEALGNLFK